MKMVQNVVVVQQHDKDIEVGFITLMLLAGVIALVIQYFWAVATVFALIGASVFIYMRLTEQALRSRKLAVDADRQNRQFLQGDPRGMYGDFDEGLEQR